MNKLGYSVSYEINDKDYEDEFNTVDEVLDWTEELLNLNADTDFTIRSKWVSDEV